MKTYDLSFDGNVLRRGFWIYVAQIDTSDHRQLIYVGRTGDSSSPHAQSPFNRIGRHLDPRRTSKSNALTRWLDGRQIDPRDCRFHFLAFGPVFDEVETMVDHRPVRDVMAALESRTAVWFKEHGFDLLGEHSPSREVDPAKWTPIELALVARFSTGCPFNYSQNSANS